MDEKQVRKILQGELKKSFNKRIGDTPTDALQVVNRKYVASTYALPTSGTVSFNPLSASVFTLTPTAATQLTPTQFPAGKFMTVRILTSGTNSYTITFSTGFVANSTLSTGTLDGRYYTVAFVCDGKYWNEISRTPAMLPS